MPVLKKSYTFQWTFGKNGQSDGLLNFPDAVAIDESGNYFVVDTMNNRIQAFKSDGKFLHAFGYFGEEDGDLGEGVNAIAFHPDGHLVVVDTNNHRVQLFSPEGDFKLKFGGCGVGDTNMQIPSCVAFTHDNDIVISDSGNDRIQVHHIFPDFLMFF